MKATVESVTAQMDTVIRHAPVSVRIIINITYYSYSCRRAERVRNMYILYIAYLLYMSIFPPEYYSVSLYFLALNVIIAIVFYLYNQEQMSTSKWSMVV